MRSPSSPSLPQRRSPWRLAVAVAVLACAVAFSLPGVAMADRDAELAEAQEQLATMEAQLVADRDLAESLEAQLASVNGLVAEGQERTDALEVALHDARLSVEANQRFYDKLQSQMDVMVRESFKYGGATYVAALLGAESSGDLTERLTTISMLTTNNRLLSDETAAAKATLQATSAEASTLINEQQAAVKDMQAHSEALVRQSELLRKATEQVTISRDELLATVVRLKAILGSGDYQALQDAFKGKESVTYGQWAKLFAGELGAPMCKENLILLVTWQMNEGTDAQWNPLATTYDMAGATQFNWVGVKNYASLADGLDASRLTLERGYDIYGYGDIIQSLKKCGKAEDTAAAIAASSWCGCGSGYVASLVDNVRKNYDQYSKI